MSRYRWYGGNFMHGEWFVTIAFIAVMAGASPGCGASDQEVKHRDANGVPKRSDKPMSGNEPIEHIPEHGSAVAP